jgi:hypothetical protein
LGGSNTKFKNNKYDHNCIEYIQKNNKNWIRAYLTAKSGLITLRVVGYLHVIHAIAKETENAELDDEFDGRGAEWRYSIADPNCINKLRKTIEIAFKHFKV